MQLLVLVYNDGFVYAHFAWNILDLCCAILLISVGIRLFHDQSQLAIAYVFIGSDASSFYCNVFHRAFSVPVILKKN